jgi:hypothetical protein
MDYRLYLFDLKGEAAAAVPFLAGDDLEAMELGALILRESRDVFSRHEVWSGVRHLTGSNLVVLISWRSTAARSEATARRGD